jgi:hypothetical protein
MANLSNYVLLFFAVALFILALVLISQAFKAFKGDNKINQAGK